MHSHQSLAQTALAMREMHLNQDQVAVVMSSLTHLVGFGMVFLSGLLNGATVVITRPFDFRSVLQAYARWGCTYTMGLPVMFHGLLQAQSEMQFDVASGRFYFCGGDSVPAVLQDAFQAVFGPVSEAYGMTELTPAAWNRPGDVRVGSIGRPGEGIGFRLLDPDGRDVKSGEVGEICVQGPQLMIGYWQDPDATATAVRNGWFHTGDLASFVPTAFIGSQDARKRSSFAAEAISPRKRSRPSFTNIRRYVRWVLWADGMMSGEKSWSPLLSCDQASRSRRPS
jgi:long-chain acyl-CoA synthetase